MLGISSSSFSPILSHTQILPIFTASCHSNVCPGLHRNLTLLFGPGESRLLVAISILDDSIPEIDEDFVVSLSSPVGGARLGPLISSTITILTNDNAHGLIAFSNRSRSIILSESDSNFVVPLEVERRFGTFGLVRVDWTLTGDHTTGEITPSSGQVES